jgi:hypothetical protein
MSDVLQTLINPEGDHRLHHVLHQARISRDELMVNNYTKHFRDPGIAITPG